MKRILITTITQTKCVRKDTFLLILFVKNEKQTQKKEKQTKKTY